MTNTGTECQGINKWRVNTPPSPCAAATQVKQSASHDTMMSCTRRMKRKRQCGCTVQTAPPGKVSTRQVGKRFANALTLGVVRPSEAREATDQRVDNRSANLRQRRLRYVHSSGDDSLTTPLREPKQHREDTPPWGYGGWPPQAGRQVGRHARHQLVKVLRGHTHVPIKRALLNALPEKPPHKISRQGGSAVGLAADGDQVSQLGKLYQLGRLAVAA